MNSETRGVVIIALDECLPNLDNVSNIYFQVTDENKINNTLIGEVVRNIWPCLKIVLLHVLHLKSVSGVKIM